MMVEGIGMHEDEDVLGADLVAAHLLRCPRHVACDALLICCQNVTGAPKLRVRTIQ